MHEQGPAGTDDGLLGSAMPVVGEPFPVVLDQSPEVTGSGEEVVDEESVTVVGRLLGYLRGAHRPMPHERRHTFQRPRNRGEPGQRSTVISGPVDDVFPP